MKNAAILLHIEIDDNVTREQLIRDIAFIKVGLKGPSKLGKSCIERIVGLEFHSVQVFDPDVGRVVVYQP